MSELVGARAIADALSRLAGIAVSAKQVYRLAVQERGPIRADRERWTVRADAAALEQWWTTGHFPRTFGKRLRNMALGRERAPVAKRRQIEVRAGGNAGELMIVGVVGTGQLSTQAFLAAVKELGEVETIRVVVNSDGGLVNDGLAIYHALRTHKAKVHVEIVGVAASMASAIAMAGDKISMAEDGLFMMHDPWGNGVTGNADDLRAAAEQLDKYGESLAGIYSRRTKHTEGQILQMMKKNGGEGTWLNATEALELGFIDEIISPAQARLPASIPAAAMAKRVTKAQRQGDPPVKKFAAKIAALIAAMVKADKTKEDVIDDLAVESELTVEKVTEILESKAFPTLAQLRAFADVLGSTTKELRPLAEADGHKFEAKKPAKAPAQAPALAQVPDVQAAVQAALAADRTRVMTIQAAGRQHGLPDDAVAQIVSTATDVAAGNAAVLAWLADPKNKPRICGVNPHATITVDERDKWLDGMSQHLIIKAGSRGIVEAHAKKIGKPVTLDGGNFRGMTLLDIARDVLEREGVSVRGMTPMQVAKAVTTVRADGRGLGTRSDFPVLLENVLHKMLLAAYAIAPDKWRKFCAVGSVQDFRDHPRLRIGSLSQLSELLETGEFAQMHFPDAKKEVIKAKTYGNIIGLTRQAIVNDDVDGFARMVTMLGRASALTIEINVFALLALNSGTGPTMNDGQVLFHSSHNNIDGTSAVPDQAAFERGRILMASQLEPNGKDYTDLRPNVWLGPIGKGATARAAIKAEFDFDQSNKFMKPNVVRDLVGEIVDTPRISGNRWYLFADPNIAPVIEVVFLQGEEAPVIETEEGFDFDGIRWKIRHDHGVGATDFRGATTNAGA
jgi:ATP-dependent protease ClpP protease subunit